MNNIQPQDWFNAGYKKFNEVKHMHMYASFGLQKLFSDDKGKRYYLTVYVYEDQFIKRMFPSVYPDFRYEPDVQFCFDDKPTVNISLITTGSDWSIKGVEQQIQDLWVSVGKPYYEKWSE